jgi:hypothetical protein
MAWSRVGRKGRLLALFGCVILLAGLAGGVFVVATQQEGEANWGVPHNFMFKNYGFDDGTEDGTSGSSKCFQADQIPGLVRIGSISQTWTEDSIYGSIGGSSFGRVTLDETGFPAVYVAGGEQRNVPDHIDSVTELLVASPEGCLVLYAGGGG